MKAIQPEDTLNSARKILARKMAKIVENFLSSRKTKR